MSEYKVKVGGFAPQTGKNALLRNFRDAIRGPAAPATASELRSRTTFQIGHWTVIGDNKQITPTNLPAQAAQPKGGLVTLLESVSDQK